MKTRIFYILAILFISLSVFSQKNKDIKFFIDKIEYYDGWTNDEIRAVFYVNDYAKLTPNKFIYYGENGDKSIYTITAISEEIQKEENNAPGYKIYWMKCITVNNIETHIALILSDDEEIRESCIIVFDEDDAKLILYFKKVDMI